MEIQVAWFILILNVINVNQKRSIKCYQCVFGRHWAWIPSIISLFLMLWLLLLLFSLGANETTQTQNWHMRAMWSVILLKDAVLFGISYLPCKWIIFSTQKNQCIANVDMDVYMEWIWEPPQVLYLSLVWFSAICPMNIIHPLTLLLWFSCCFFSNAI